MGPFLQFLRKPEICSWLFIAVLFLTGCNKAKKDWEFACFQNTAEDYLEYLYTHDKGIYLDSARLKLEKIRFAEADSIGTIEAYEMFLMNDPEMLGTYEDTARARIVRILYRQVASINTFSAYNKFLQDYPDNPFKEEAASAIERLYEERHPALRNTRKVKIILDENYAGGIDFHNNFASFARMVSNSAGLEVVEDTSSDYDLTLTLNSRAWAKSHPYQLYGMSYAQEQYFYSEGGLSGTITIITDDRHSFNSSFRDYQKPLESVSHEYKEPEKIIGEVHESSSFYLTLVNMMHELYGNQILISGLGGSSKMRDAAGAILIKNKEPKTLTPLMVLLGDEEISHYVSDILVDIGRPAISSLIAALDTAHAYEKSRIAFTLGEIQDTSAVGPLISAIEDQNANVRTTVIWALAKIRDLRAVVPLIGTIDDEDQNVRIATITTLGSSKDRRASNPLIAVLNHPDIQTRANAIEALGKIKENEAVDELIRCLSDPDDYIRSQSCWSLGEIGDRRAVEPLIALLEDDAVISDAAIALGKIKDSRAVEPLIAVLDHEDCCAQEQISDALYQISGKRFKRCNCGLISVRDMDEESWF